MHKGRIGRKVMNKIGWIIFTAVAPMVAILLGGFYFWLIKKPETKPHLAARLHETEAEIMKEVEKHSDRREAREEENGANPS